MDEDFYEEYEPEDDYIDPDEYDEDREDELRHDEDMVMHEDAGLDEYMEMRISGFSGYEIEEPFP